MYQRRHSDGTSVASSSSRMEHRPSAAMGPLSFPLQPPKGQDDFLLAAATGTSSLKRTLSSGGAATANNFYGQTSVPLVIHRPSFELTSDSLSPFAGLRCGSFAAAAAAASGDAAPHTGGVAESTASSMGHSPSLTAAQHLCLLDPVAIHHPSSVQTPSDGVSPFTRSRSCESAWVMLDYGVTAEQGVRRTMEDQHTMLAEGIPFFGVYDGHGGTQCAEYLRDHLHTMILSHPEIKTDPEKAIREGIAEADRRFLEVCARDKTESGSVCAVALFVGGSLVVGNVGDAEAVLCRGGQPLLLTVPHNPRKNAQEAERVVAAGGRLSHNRVGHPKFNPSVISLAVSRAIGDVGFKCCEYTDGKPSGVISVPDTTSIQLTPEDEFLLIGCDGLWDVLTHAEAVALCRSLLRSGCTPNDITERLVDEAIAKGTTDNVTVAFISCKPTSSHAARSGSPTHRQGTSPHLSSASSGMAIFCQQGTSPLCCDTPQR